MSKVIKLNKSIKHFSKVSPNVAEYLKDPELKQLIDEQVARAHKNGYQEGYAQGSREARDQEQKKFAEATRLIDALAQQFNRYSESVYIEIEHETVRLLFALCESIIRKELSYPDEISGIIRDALQKIGAQPRELVLKLHPHAAHYFEQIVEQLKQQHIDMSQISVEIDETVGEGGCYLISDTTVVDGRVRMILHEMQAKIEELIRWEQPLNPPQSPA